MARIPEDTRNDLLALVDGTFPSPPQLVVPVAGVPVRRSAVLILFGALDRIPAAVSGSGTHGAAAPDDPAARNRTITGSAVPPELDVLLIRRGDGLRHHPGEIAFPGGGVEEGDADVVATALREAEEETGLDPTGVEVLGTLPEVHLPVSNNLVTPVVGWWRRPSETVADRTESVEVFRAPVADLLDPDARAMSVLEHDASVHRGAAFVLSERFGRQVVWSFTGILLASLFDHLGWSVPWDVAREVTISV